MDKAVLPIAAPSAGAFGGVALVGSGQGAPGAAMSPPNAETLRTSAKTVALQIAFIVFIVFSYSVFPGYSIDKAVEHEGGRPTAGLLNDAHHSHMSILLQGFLHLLRRSDLT